MEIYNETAKTKTNALLVTRPIGALVIGMSQPFSALSNETITAFIERANGNNTEICTDFPLSAFMALSTAGGEAIFQDDTHTRSLCEICEEGAINLQETEAIKIKLDGLKSGVTYTINGLEYPATSNSVVRLTRKNILDGETEKRYEVSEQELMIIEGIDNILEMNVSFANGTTCKYVPEEIKAISRDFDAIKSVKVGMSPSASYDLPNLVTYHLVAVNSVDIKKKSVGAVTLYLKNDVTQF